MRRRSMHVLLLRRSLRADDPGIARRDSRLTPSLSNNRPSNGKHRQRTPPPRLFRIPLRLTKPSSTTTTGYGKDYIPRYVDEYLLFASFRRARRNRFNIRHSHRRRPSCCSKKTGSGIGHQVCAGTAGEV